MTSLMEAPAEVEATAPAAEADRAWWARESARRADRRELAAHYAEAAGRDFDGEADDATALDLYQGHVLPF